MSDHRLSGSGGLMRTRRTSHPQAGLDFGPSVAELGMSLSGSSSGHSSGKGHAHGKCGPSGMGMESYVKPLQFKTKLQTLSGPAGSST